MASPGKAQKEGRSEEDGGKIEWKLSEVIACTVSRGQHELIGESNMAAGELIVLGGRL